MSNKVLIQAKFVIYIHSKEACILSKIAKDDMQLKQHLYCAGGVHIDYNQCIAAFYYYSYNFLLGQSSYSYISAMESDTWSSSPLLSLIKQHICTGVLKLMGKTSIITIQFK